MKYYSPNTKGFYDKTMHKDIPKDAIEITDDVYQLLKDGQTDGKIINFDGIKLSVIDYVPSEDEISLKAKQAIELQLATLTVKTTKGNIFDANKDARQNMSDSILASNTLKELIDKGALPPETIWNKTLWRLANNNEIIITLDELKEAHALSIQEYARIKGICA